MLWLVSLSATNSFEAAAAAAASCVLALFFNLLDTDRLQLAQVKIETTG